MKKLLLVTLLLTAVSTMAKAEVVLNLPRTQAPLTRTEVWSTVKAGNICFLKGQDGDTTLYIPVDSISIASESPGRTTIIYGMGKEIVMADGVGMFNKLLLSCN